MKLLRAEPGEGIVWIRRAFQVFLQQPFGLAGLFSLCALVAYAVSWIPVVGGALLPVLAPAGSLVFMIATRRVVAGERPMPGALTTLKAAGRPRLVELLKLGVAYLAASVVAMLIFMAIDGGATATWMDAVSTTASAPTPPTAPAPPPLPDARVLFSSLLRLVLLALLSVPFWHAPALVYWGQQSWVKSLFFSTLAIWRNRGAFAVYGLGWFGLSLVFAMVFSVLVALLGVPQKPSLGAVLVFVTAISLYLTLMYTSLWFTVAGCFGIDADPSSPLHKETLP
ncbi:MAG TPA: BPSS1780 family membrane protein [Caldimonas sp.]|jgi:hypothetical protein